MASRQVNAHPHPLGRVSRFHSQSRFCLCLCIAGLKSLQDECIASERPPGAFMVSEVSRNEVAPSSVSSTSRSPARLFSEPIRSRVRCRGGLQLRLFTAGHNRQDRGSPSGSHHDPGATPVLPAARRNQPEGSRSRCHPFSHAEHLPAGISGWRTNGIPASPRSVHLSGPRTPDSRGIKQHNPCHQL